MVIIKICFLNLGLPYPQEVQETIFININSCITQEFQDI